MADKFRVGLIYYSAGLSVEVEAGHRMIGRTSRDPKIGEQVFWFPSVADFHKHRRDIFECIGRFSINTPIPHFEPIEEPVPAAVEVPTAGEPDGKASVSYAEESGSTPEPVTTEPAAGSPVAEFPDGAMPQVADPPVSDPDYIGETSSGELVYPTPPTNEVSPNPEPQTTEAPVKNKGGRPRKHQ